MFNKKVHKIPRPFKAISLNLIFAENVRMLMMITPPLGTQQKLGRKAHIGQATLSRLLSGQTWPTLNLVESIAKAFKVQPWQLLVPRLDPTAFMEGAELTANEQVLFAQLHAIKAIVDKGPFTPRS